jgi:hypothetical protein
MGRAALGAAFLRMAAHPEWTGWVLGELRFAPRTMDRWRACHLQPWAHCDWPAWIEPGAPADCTVEAELLAVEAFGRARASRPAADHVSLVMEPNRVRIRALLGPSMFHLWGGQLAALFRSAEQVGAQGEVVFVERPSHHGHRLQLDGKGPGRFEALDDARLERWRDALEEMAAALPPEATSDFHTQRAPNADLHRELGGASMAREPCGLPNHYGAGPDVEVGHLTHDFAVLDASGWAAVTVQGRGMRELLKRAGAPGLGKAWRGRVGWGELRDGAGRLLDRVLGWKRRDGTLVLRGSPGRQLHLSAFLARRVAATPHVADAGGEWSAVAFAGPGAAAHLVEAGGGKAVAKLRAGRAREPAPEGLQAGGALLHAPLGPHDLWLLVTDPPGAVALLRRHRERLGGAAVWRRLHEAAGEVPSVQPPRRARG